MELVEIERLHKLHCRPDFGTTTPDELDYIQRLIRQHRPKRVIEIGTASGVTTGFIAAFIAENGGESVTSIDLRKTFFAERDQPVGYLAREIYQGQDVEIAVHDQSSSLDLSSLNGHWDMAFIDANHQHPWPTLDTLALVPYLSGPKIVIHHDLQLYRRFRAFRGVGPRILFNEMPDSHRHACNANGWNIYSLDMKMERDMLEHIAIGALSLPWTDRPPLSPKTVAAYSALFSEQYSDYFCNEFADCAAVHRKSLMFRTTFAARALVVGKLRDWNLR